MKQFNINVNRRTLFVVPVSALGFHVFQGDTLILDISASLKEVGYDWVSKEKNIDANLMASATKAIEHYLSK